VFFDLPEREFNPFFLTGIGTANKQIEAVCQLKPSKGFEGRHQRPGQKKAPGRRLRPGAYVVCQAVPGYA
jgi:hypothetical protein